MLKSDKKDEASSLPKNEDSSLETKQEKKEHVQTKEETIED